MRKPIEIEQLIVASAATEEEIAKARREIDAGAVVQFPDYSYASERIYVHGKLLHVARTYQYSWWAALKGRVLLLLGLREKAEPIKFIGG